MSIRSKSIMTKKTSNKESFDRKILLLSAITYN